MKKVLLIAFAIFMTLGFSSAWAGGGRMREYNLHGNSTKSGTQTPTSTVSPEADLMLRHNAHVARYIQSDLSTQMHSGKSCNADGYYTSKIQDINCMDFKSRSTGSSWRVAFDGNGNAQAVFQVVNGNAVRWVQFKEGTQQVIYQSPGAQQYAMAHGGGSQPAMAQENPQQPAPAANPSGPCAGLSGAALIMCKGASGFLGQ